MENEPKIFTGYIKMPISVADDLLQAAEAIGWLTAKRLLEEHPLEYNRICEFNELP